MGEKGVSQDDCTNEMTSNPSAVVSFEETDLRCQDLR